MLSLSLPSPRRSIKLPTFVFLVIGAGLATLPTLAFSKGCSWSLTACIAAATCEGAGSSALS